MRVVIVGAGQIGSRVTVTLTAAGHDVVALGRTSGIDTSTGAGVAEAVAGADVVMDLTNSRSEADDEVLAFFRASTRHLLAAEEQARVGHHVILSVVGADRLTGSGYLRAKLVQEDLVRDGPIPYTIVRSTQFFEFLAVIADVMTEDGTVRVPSARLQPIAASDVAARVGEIAVGDPVNGIVEIAGPEPLGIDELVRRQLAATGDERGVVTDPDAEYFGARLHDAALTPTPGGGAWIAPTRFDDWLSGRPR